MFQPVSRSSVPRRSPVPEETEAEASTLKQSPLVLVVDDDAGMRAYLCDGLRRLSVRVVEVSDGAEALALAPSLLADGLALVITDIVMPGLDGRALKAALGKNPDLHHVPVLLITGEALHVSDAPVLRKPFNTRRLHARVQALLPP